MDSLKEREKVVMICACSFACPSMKDVNIPELAERIRLELSVRTVVLHSRLCEPDGENFMEDYLKEGNILYITPACKEEKQAKLLRDGFKRAGVEMNEKTWAPVSMSFKDTDTVFNEIKKIVEG